MRTAPFLTQPGFHPALVLDLDGTCRKSKSSNTFINEIDDQVLYDDVEQKLHEYRDNGYLIIGVTNQGGVAFGYTTTEKVMSGLSYFQNLFDANPFHCIFACMTHPQATNEAFRKRSLMRKPHYGMLCLAENQCSSFGFEIDWDHSLMIGDREEDRLCAEGAGIAFTFADQFFGR